MKGICAVSAAWSTVVWSITLAKLSTPCVTSCGHLGASLTIGATLVSRSCSCYSFSTQPDPATKPLCRSGFGSAPRRCGSACAGCGMRREGANIVNCGVHGVSQRFWVIGGVGEQGATLVRDDQGDREVARVGVGTQIAAALHRGEPGPEQCQPLVVAGGEIVVDFRVGFGQFPCQRTVDASTLPVDGIDVGNGVIGPCLQGLKAVQSAQPRLSVKLLDVVAACGDDLAGQIALVVEIMRNLRSAHRRRVADLVDAGPCDTALEHQPGGGVDDARPSRASFTGKPRCGGVGHVASP